MNMQGFKPLLWMGVAMLVVSMACSIGGGAATQAPVVTSAPVVVATEPPTSEPPTPEPLVETEPPAKGGVSSLQDVQKAIIQIESQGTFIDPEFGLVLNGAGRGSGFIIDPSGIAVTNNHVVTGAALLQVWIGGEDEPHNARVLGVSECSDLAVIDIDGEGYDYLDWYDGSINVGMDMYIAGFPLGDPEYTLTKGVISKAKTDGETAWSSVDSVVEYDATSNPGNSGGPVVTADGKVLAVHYAGNASTRQAYGISRDIALDVIDVLKGGEDVDTIGVNGTAVGTDDGSITGVWVSSVQSGSPADKAGLQAGDIILQMENLVLATDGTLSQYCDILRSHEAGDTLSLSVLRWASNEFLEGQLNGRELAVTSTYDSSSGGTGDTSGTTSGTDIVNPNAASGEYFFFTDFDGGLDSWRYFLMSGKDEGFTLETTGSRLRFDIDDETTWVYLYYADWEYTDVRIDTIAENLGMNTNNVSLFCRYSDDGWYEFNIANNGEFWIYYFDNSINDYRLLWSGGSNAINMGKDINEYTAFCVGNQLSLYINGVEAKTVTHKNLKSGLVGLSVSSFDVTPITVEFDNFSVTAP